jgi:replicative DNA helicase
LQAEESLLGAMLLSRDAIATAIELCSAADFYKPAHGHVFEAIHSLYGQGEPADPVTVADELRRAGLLEAIGGPATLVSLQAGTPATSNAARYARIVEEHSQLRKLIAAAGEIAELGYELPEDVQAAVDRAEQLVFEVAQRKVTDTVRPLRDLLTEALDNLEALFDRGEAITGVPTGFVDLDERLSGLQPSNLIIVGARPSMGKCVAWDTPIVDAVTGAVRTAAEVHALGSAGTDVMVVALGADRRLQRRRPSAFVDDGIKPVFRVRTRSGREVRTTITHPFLTPDGWRPLGELAVGTPVAVPRRLPIFGTDERPDAEVAMLGYLACDGPRVAPPSDTVLDDIVATAHALGADVLPDRATASVTDNRPTMYRLVSWSTGRLRDMLAEHQLCGWRPAERTLPDAVYRLPRRQLALFLNRLFAMHGAAGWSAAGHGSVTLRSPSKAVALGVQHLLVRFGLNGRVREKITSQRGHLRRSFDVELTGADDVRRFIVEIGILGQEDASLGLTGMGRRMLTKATVPASVWSQAARAAEGEVRGGTDAVVATGDLARDDVLWDEVAAIEYTGDEQVYDLTVPGDHNFVAADVFVHNTSFALNIASHAAVNDRKNVLFFSLEMSHHEITQRLLCSEARVPSNRVRNGRLHDSDWPKISHAIGRLGEAPLMIDDNPMTTVMDIRTKARRMKSRDGLDLVIIDYLQLMSGRDRAENRQVEVSEISRGLKILARELGVPVIALSQLSRNLELRADKRPALADLRESGCLTADTRVLRADTGVPVSMAELLLTGERDIPVWTVDDDLHLSVGRMSHVFASGVKPVFELALASGRRVKASANHPFLTLEGWRRLDELADGTRLAVPRSLPAPTEPSRWPDAEVVMLAHLLGDGCFASRQPVHYTSADEQNLTAVEAAAAHFGITPRRVVQRTWAHVYLPAPFRLTHGRRNPIQAWLEPMGLAGLRSAEKFIPRGVFQLPDDQVSLFLHHLWATDGSVGMYKQQHARLYYASTSRRLVNDVQTLLLRFGIQSRIKTARKSGYRDGYHLHIYGIENQRRFAEAVGVHGERGRRLAEVMASLAHIQPNTNVDTVPASVWRRVKERMQARGVTSRQLAAGLKTAYCGSTLYKHAPSRQRLGTVATLLADPGLERLASSDLFWDTVVAITPLGEEPVYDATVDGTHNFIADGIVAHNSLEQDADVVMFIYRDEVYNDESPDRATAEIIVAKHRNGPTGRTQLVFHEDFTRFANMARV